MTLCGTQWARITGVSSPFDSEVGHLKNQCLFPMK